MSQTSTAPDTASAHQASWRRVALVGVVAGFASGLFGVGGGIVIVPLLVMLAGFPHKLATGTSLTAIVPISVAGIVGYATAGEVDWAAALCVAAGAAVGTVVGTRWLVRMSSPVLRVTFAGAMLLTAARMFVDSGEGTGRADLDVGIALALAALGLASGLLAGLLGVGGGIIIVPVLTLLFGFPHVLAKGTSLAVVLPTAVIGTVRNRRSGLTAVGQAAIVGVAGVGSAFAASKVSLGLDAGVSQALFAALLTIVAARMAHAGLAAMRAGGDAAPGDEQGGAPAGDAPGLPGEV